MTESSSEKIMQMQMVPSYCGSWGHWSMERRTERKRSSSLALRLGKPNFSVLNPPPTSLPTVWLSIFSENMSIRFLSIYSPASFLQLFSFWVSCWHLPLPGSWGKVEEAEPDLLDRHRAKKSAVDAKPVSGSCARQWLPGVQRYEQGAVVLGCMMILRMLFQRRSNT